MVKDVYDQNIPTVAFWSLATSSGHVGIPRGKLMWHKIQPGPIRFSTWAKPNNSAFLLYIFLLIFASYMGWPSNSAFLFLDAAFYSVWSFTFCYFIFHCFTFVPNIIISYTGPTRQKFQICSNYFDKWVAWVMFSLHTFSNHIHNYYFIWNRNCNSETYMKFTNREDTLIHIHNYYFIHKQREDTLNSQITQLLLHNLLYKNVLELLWTSFVLNLLKISANKKTEQQG